MTNKQLWDNLIDEYFKRYPEAGLAWWQAPLDEQPEGYKIRMYDILWDLTYREEK